VLGIYSETVSQMVLCCGFTLRQCHKWYCAGDLQWDSVTNGTVLWIYTETVSQMVLCWGFTVRQCHKWYRVVDLHWECHKWYCAVDLQWDGVTNGTMLWIYSETVSQMVPCCGFTLRQCHKWHSAGVLHRDSVTDGTVLWIYSETVPQMVLCGGLPLKQCQIIPYCQYTEAVSQMASYCRFSRDVPTNIQYGAVYRSYGFYF